MKDYQEAINFQQALLNTNISEIKDKQHSHSCGCVKVSTEQESIFSLSYQSDSSYQSEERCLSDFIKEVSHRASLCFKVSQNQFLGMESELHSASPPNMVNMSQDEIQNMIQTTVTAALAVNNHQ